MQPRASRRVTVYLTCVGGGAFGNAERWILDAIERAVASAASLPLDLVLVHYGTCPSGPRYTRLEREAAADAAGDGDGDGGSSGGGGGDGDASGDASGGGGGKGGGAEGGAEGGAAGGKRSERSSPGAAPGSPSARPPASKTTQREREPAQAGIRQFFPKP